MNILFFELIQIGIGTRDSLTQVPSDAEWQDILRLAHEQAIVGVLLSAIEQLPAEHRPEKDVLLQWIGEARIIRARNEVLDKRVVELCKAMDAEGVSMLVFKGQTLARLYHDKGLRQSGDIDFYVHDNDWLRAIAWLNDQRERGEIDNYEDNTTIKDVQYSYRGVAYEMHRMLVAFSAKSHQRYWDKVVVPEIWQSVSHVDINGYDVPTLSPVMNVLYVFVHIFEHLISDGVGLRQFVDWFYIIDSIQLTDDCRITLEQHLKGLGLLKAYKGLGAILTDYLGLPKERFPFEISDQDHKDAAKLVENIIQMGNFGHNVQYQQNKGVIHGVQHLKRIYRQARLFGHYAPLEAWCKLPSMIEWWGRKICRMVCK